MFEEYIKNGTPEQKERAENWQIAIGLQEVDNLKVSQVLIELARRHIEGKITIEEVEQRIWEHHNK
ncbi:MAG: antitoxin VbhA family protein [Anaerotignum sp.]|uniref:antitoxin VbhA family protein n=1 Tax=Anaerotignum sp. TaxID=2039241 RepID=UPI003995D42D